MTGLPRRVSVLGPTASGKSSVALAAASRLGGVELVSVDAMQVYRGMDIGTAKPTADEQRSVPHHLIDLVEPTAEFTVADFQRAYEAAVGDIAARQRRALLVGGTGLYHRAVIDGFTLPGQWPAVRARLDREVVDLGSVVLHERLVGLDPAAASKIDAGNSRRIVRALEVCEGSGRPFSSFGPGLDSYPASDVVQVGLRWDRDDLTARIARRVHTMIEDGLVGEVEGLVATGLSKTAAQALGYKEVRAHLAGDTTLDEAIGAIVARTRRFAVRQERWFRRDPRIRWIDITHDPVAEALPAVIEALA